jgi:signal transduction histidine kinase
MFHSIRWRLVASYVLLTVLAVAVVGLLSLEIVRRYSSQQEMDALRANAEVIAEQALPHMWPNASVQELGQLAQAASFLSEARVRILDNLDRVLADSGSPAASEELILIVPSGQVEGFFPQKNSWFNLQVYTQVESLPFEVESLPSYEELAPGGDLVPLRWYHSPWGGRLVFGEIYRSGKEVRIESPPEATPAARSSSLVRLPIGEGADTLGYVELSAGPDFTAAALTAARSAFLTAGVGASLLATIVGLMMSQRLTSPLRKLGQTAVQMGAGDLSARAQVRSQDEIGALAAQFNSMADQLQVSFLQLQSERDSLRRFIADASHELRTPVTALKNYLTLLQGPAAEDRPTQAEFLAESQAQVDRLEWITRNLLDLTRLDAGLVELELADHDLCEILASVAASFKPMMENKGILLKIEAPDCSAPILLHCDRPRLELALGNLLDNAVKFTPQGGNIEIGAGQSEGATRIWVQDDGPGISADELPHIFERFYRGRSHTGSGSGLGLAIVQSLVEAQGGRLSVESVPGEGARFTMEWLHLL